MKKQGLIISILFITIVMLSLVKVFITNGLATNGITISEMQQKTKTLSTENIILGQKLLDIASLTTIASRAADMGFVEEKTPLYVENTDHIASAQ